MDNDDVRIYVMRNKVNGKTRSFWCNGLETAKKIASSYSYKQENRELWEEIKSPEEIGGKNEQM